MAQFAPPQDTIPAPAAPQKAAQDIELITENDPRCGIVSINPARMSGAPCFVNSRVPIRHLFDYLEAGETLTDFLDGFEGIPRERCIAALRLACQRIEELPAA